MNARAHAYRKRLCPRQWKYAGLFCFLVLGCSGVPVPKPKLPPIAGMPSGGETAKRPAEAPGKWNSYVGVIHVHTAYSDGGGGFTEIARLANRQQLDFVITTDHDTLKPQRNNEEGWRGTTLVLAGTELSTPDGHLLALGIREEIPARNMTTEAVIEAVQRQGGICFIAHPFGKTPWKNRDIAGINGIEVFNVKHDILHAHWQEMALRALTQPEELLYLNYLRRPKASLDLWDRRLQQGAKLYAIAGADAHEFGLGNVRFARYETHFKLGRTYILTQDAQLSPGAVIEALRSGRAFAAIELQASAKGFTFEVRRRNRTIAIMGDTVPLQQNLELYIESPVPAELVLYADGKRVSRSTGLTLSHPVSGAGIYRVEANRHNKPWVITNPIFVE